MWVVVCGGKRERDMWIVVYGRERHVDCSVWERERYVVVVCGRERDRYVGCSVWERQRHV